MLRTLFRKKSPALPTIPPGRRVYAIGDVHGRLDRLDALLAAIDADDAARGAAETSLILLGDLVDRGPDSAGVVARVGELMRDRSGTVLLMGNHEEILLTAARGERQALSLFDKVGGRETLLSYGVDAEVYDHAALDQVAALIRQAVPEEHLALMASGTDCHRVGGYAFVHAGIRPGVPLDAQKPEDLRWIRQTFLQSRADHGAMIVHGHTITRDVDVHPNRIGIDTGAYVHGILTAIGLEAEDRWFLQTEAD